MTEKQQKAQSVTSKNEVALYTQEVLLDKIIDRGDTLITTKGKLPKQNRVHTARAKPLVNPSIPIAVLILSG